ncbi:MAG: hypothetical protein M1820_008497 [Bogoriella megaspora]|nr:MAG: hypothetical protein M1820_008497 [Bogoriella megaspora]
MADLLRTPTAEELREIAAKQDVRAKETQEARKKAKSEGQIKEEEQAAEMIQRNYRGYRARRQMKGMGLDSSTRWLEAVKEAQYRNRIRPQSRRKRSKKSPTSQASDSSPSMLQDRPRTDSDALKNWRKATTIARHAGSDDTSDTSGSEGMNEAQLSEHRAKKQSQKREREKWAKMMDLQYFLEMVDSKHRYGSNLRAYHAEWKKADTNENFFYWLDEGDGRNVELPTVSRERLYREQVRYLSREERQQYLVSVNSQGLLCWAKNGERISTTVDYKDSVHGIVDKDDSTPTYHQANGIGSQEQTHQSDEESTSSSDDASSIVSAEGEHYVNHDLKQAKGLKKVQHVSTATILNHLLRKSVKPNSWIFVADTSFRLYVGIKQSGAFQHSSFLQGMRTFQNPQNMVGTTDSMLTSSGQRLLAAGLIKIKDGQLRRLSPLSGHYRPPTSNFRAFVHALRDEGVDMSRVSISRSYAILVGLEAYVKTRRKVKKGVEKVEEKKEEMIHPEEMERKREKERDKSESAEKERRYLEETRKKEEEERRKMGWSERMLRRLGIGKKKRQEDVQRKEGKAIVKVEKKEGEDVEAGIAPEGRR